MAFEASEVKAKAASGSTASYSSQYGYSASASPSLLSVTWSTLTGTGTKEGPDSSTPSPPPQASSGVSVAMLTQLGIIAEGHQRLFGAFLQMPEKDVTMFREEGSKMTTGSFRFDAGVWTATTAEERASEHAVPNSNLKGEGGGGADDGSKDNIGKWFSSADRFSSGSKRQFRSVEPDESTTQRDSTRAQHDPSQAFSGHKFDGAHASEKKLETVARMGDSLPQRKWEETEKGDVNVDTVRATEEEETATRLKTAADGGKPDLDLELWMDKKKREYKQQQASVQQQQQLRGYHQMQPSTTVSNGVSEGAKAPAVKLAVQVEFESLNNQEAAGVLKKLSATQVEEEGKQRRRLLHFLRSDRVDRIQQGELQYMRQEDTLVDDKDYIEALNRLRGMPGLGTEQALRLSTWPDDKRFGRGSLVAEEERACSWYWSALVPELDSTAPFTMMTLGHRLALLDTKLSLAYPNAVVVSIKPYDEAVARHLEFIDLMQVRNNILCRSTMPAGRVAKLAASQDPFRYQVVGSEFWARIVEEEDPTLVCNPLWFEKQLGAVLLNGWSTFLEVPPWSILQAAVDLLLGSQCAASEGIDWFVSRYVGELEEEEDMSFDSISSMHHPELSPYLKLVSLSVSSVIVDAPHLGEAIKPSVRLLSSSKYGRGRGESKQESSHAGGGSK